MTRSDSWLALVIGNSRLHWAWFAGNQLQQTWNGPHLTHPIPLGDYLTTQTNLPVGAAPPPLWMASVVPAQTRYWQHSPGVNLLTLEHIPMTNLYPTLGIDRALALWGAIASLHAPALVIDAGTALTFTGSDASLALVGGAILPGLGLQLRALSQHTAALPALAAHASLALPPRWATTTPDAIYSGVLYTLLATLRDFIHDWLTRFPDSAIALTGGDGALLSSNLRHRDGAIASRLVFDPDLIFRGIPQLRHPT